MSKRSVRKRAASDWTRLPKKLHVQQYVVAFLDVLGMRDALRKLDHDPMEGSMVEDTLIAALKNSTMAIETFFELYNRFAESFRSASREKIAGLSEQQSLMVRRWQRARIEHQVFGDTLLLYFRVKSSDDHSAVSALYAVVVACASLCLLQLGREHPIRGGVEMGLGVELADGSLYSSAVVKAYDLESRAGYPRVLVGDRLWQYINQLTNCQAATVRQNVEQQILRTVADLIFEDESGARMIDFFGAKMRDVCGPDRRLVTDTLSFVERAKNKFAAEGNQKLATRYQETWKYLESRRHLWGE